MQGGRSFIPSKSSNSATEPKKGLKMRLDIFSLLFFLSLRIQRRRFVCKKSRYSTTGPHRCFEQPFGCFDFWSKQKSCSERGDASVWKAESVISDKVSCAKAAAAAAGGRQTKKKPPTSIRPPVSIFATSPPPGWAHKWQPGQCCKNSGTKKTSSGRSSSSSLPILQLQFLEISSICKENNRKM